MPSTSRGVAQVKPGWPGAAWRRASAVHLWALTWGRNRGPGRAAAMVARLCSKRLDVDDEGRRRQLVEVHACSVAGSSLRSSKARKPHDANVTGYGAVPTSGKGTSPSSSSGLAPTWPGSGIEAG